MTRPIEFENRMQLEHCHGKKYIEKIGGRVFEISSFNLEAGKSLYPVGHCAVLAGLQHNASCDCCSSVGG